MKKFLLGVVASCLHDTKRNLNEQDVVDICYQYSEAMQNIVSFLTGQI